MSTNALTPKKEPSESHKDVVLEILKRLYKEEVFKDEVIKDKLLSIPNIDINIVEKDFIEKFLDKHYREILVKDEGIVTIDNHLVRLSPPSKHTRPGKLINIKTNGKKVNEQEGAALV